MDLVNEYLRAVTALLPKAQREDIIAELRDTILSHVEAREGDLGRALTGDETEAVLREVGHPLVVAARYREGPQHVVGPTLYPYWLFAVKAAIALQALVASIVLLVTLLDSGDIGQALGRAVGSGVTGTLVMIGAATGVGWILERHGGRVAYLDRWRVRDLRFLEIATWDLGTLRSWAVGQRARQQQDRGQPWGPWRPAGPVARGLALMVVGAALILWWTGILTFGLNVDLGDVRRLDVSVGSLETFRWSAFKALVFWPVLAYWTVFVLQGALLLAHPDARRLQGAVEAVRGALLLGFCLWLNIASPLASSLSICSLSDFVQRMVPLARTPPLPLEPIVALFVLNAAATGVFLLVRGLWTLALGRPRQELAPAAGSSPGAGYAG
jgi:hypothetical protein